MYQTAIKTMFISCLILSAGSCRQPEDQINNLEAEKHCLAEDFISKIEFEQPKKQAVTEGIPLTGAVAPNPDRVIHFVSLVEGIVSNTSFALGDQVSKGQVLAELRSAELSSLQSQAKTIESQIQVAEQNLQSVQSMYEDDIASLRDLMEAQSGLDVLKAELEKIQANLRLFSASPENDVFQIIAPSSGIITSKNIAAGMQITGGSEALFTISDLSEVWVLVNVYATNVMNIETGMKVNIRTLSYPDKGFDGEISAISQVLDEEARVLKARVVLENKELLLKPGMIVDVTALKQIDVEAFGIPTAAMVFDHSRNYVVVYHDRCNAEIREVEIITQSNGVTFISEGLNEHEQIVTQNQLLIYEQVKSFQN